MIPTKIIFFGDNSHSFIDTKMQYMLFMIIVGFLTRVVVTDCPRLCECKWKGGKETVICHNANLSSVPLYLDSGTQVIDLTSNSLVTIKHDEFSKAGLINLQRIFVSKCRLKSLERFAFRHLNNLIELDLSYNALTSVPSHTFDSIPELREIKLSGNPIQRITSNSFTGIPQLVRLEMSDCHISIIENKAFKDLEDSLEWLKLDNNRLVEVKSSIFTVLRNLHELELAGNPWNCSCALKPLREWMVHKKLPFGVPPVCQTPKRLHGKTWDKLDLDEFACMPKIFAYNTKAHGIEGKNVTMTCRIKGIPEPNVRWLLKNKVIANLSGSSSTGRKLYIVHSQNNSSELTIFSADLQDAGVYTCAAENKAGKVEASVTLAVSRKPPESTFSVKFLIASAVTGVAFIIVSCVLALCVCSVRTKQMLRWQTRECRREDNYEKIEMNHKVVSNSNGGVQRQLGEISIVGGKRNGDYSVVPAADTDQEAEDEEDNPNSVLKSRWGHGDKSIEKRWDSPERLLDSEDLHIPRRTTSESREDYKKAKSLTSGTYNNTVDQPSSSSDHLISSQPLPSHIYDTESPIFTTNCQDELGGLSLLNVERKYPDLLDNSTSSLKYDFTLSSRKANSEGGSVSDLTDFFCTLPRKKGLTQNSRYRSTDSQAPLLESRYTSSGGSSFGSQESTSRRLSDCQRYPINNLNKNKNRKVSNSYLNLAKEQQSFEVSSTPLLDVAGLENRVSRRQEIISPTTATTLTPNANSYDYHAAQLERFLEEYKSLQKQLTKMKETCDNLRLDKSYRQTSPPSTSEESRNILKRDPVNLTTSPNSNQLLENSIDFKKFESELTKYLLSKNLAIKSFNNGSGVFNN